MTGKILVLGMLASAGVAESDSGRWLSGLSHDSRLNAYFTNIQWEPIPKISSTQYISTLSSLPSHSSLELYRDNSGRIVIKSKNAAYPFGDQNCVPVDLERIRPLIFVACTEKMEFRGILINIKTFKEYQGSFLLAGISRQNIFLSNTDGSINSRTFPYPSYIAPAFIIMNLKGFTSSYLSFPEQFLRGEDGLSDTCGSLSVEKTLLPLRIAIKNEEIEMREYSEVYNRIGEKTCKAKFNLYMQTLLGRYQ